MSSNILIQGDPKYHLGHFLLNSLLKDSDFLCQIDAATGQKETRRSVLTRSIHLARCFRRVGLKPGDVVALGGNNHLDISIPYYAAIMNGLPLAGVDPYFKFGEIKHLFKILSPKIAFCQQQSLSDYQKAVQELGLDTKLVTFDGDHKIADMIEDCDKAPIEEFQIADFDTENIYAWLISTSGSTGLPKVAAIKHHAVLPVLKLFGLRAKKTLVPILHLSAVQWVSAFLQTINSMAMNQIRVQTSATATPEHVVDIINEYRPVTVTSTPSLLYHILKSEKACDLTCFDSILVTGASVYKSLLQDLKAALRSDAVVVQAYGSTETLGPVMFPVVKGPVGSCGRELPHVQVKLVDSITGETVTEPNVPAELWTKSKGMFTEYYGDAEATANAITPDGWYKTGDLLRRDENGFYFFVERFKMLIKFRSYHVVPMELEEVILQHEGVEDVCVTSILNPEDGERPAAVVVRSPGSKVTAQEIQQLVADNLSEHKRLRGGVLFVDELPMTSTGKVARAKVRELVTSPLK